MSGWFSVQREISDHPLFKGNLAHLGAWIWLISHACWKPTNFNVSGQIITLERGQICVSIRQLSSEWGWSKSTVERFITRLKTETMIGTDNGTGKNIITICNYEKYQNIYARTVTISGTSIGTAAGQQRDTKEQSNKKTTDITNVISNNRARSKPTFEIPSWVPLESWKGWIDMRTSMGKRPTNRAMTLAVNKLQELQRKGHDPGAVLDQSTLANWQGLFPVKDQENGKNRNGYSQTGLGRTFDAGKRALEKIHAMQANLQPGTNDSIFDP